MAAKKTLYFLRHAKAEAGGPDREDHARNLAARGQVDALLVGAHLVERGIAPERVLCSTAMRTAETLMKLEEAYHRTLPVKYVDKLYHATANEILAQIAATEESISRLMIIGHNPGLHQLSIMLAKQGDEALLDELAMKLPTATFVGLEFDSSWNSIKHAGGTLTHFITPKMLGGGES